MSLSLQRWIDSPEDVVRGIFAADGPLSRLMPGYVPNPSQVRYAEILARTSVIGCDPASVGKVTPLEAGTGVGKSVAILIVSGIVSVLREKPALVTTYTRHLNRQLAGKDGEVAAAVVDEVVGRAPRIAVRRPRSAFASPKACRRLAERLLDDAEQGTNEDFSRSAAEAFARLAEWTEAELVEADGAIATGTRRSYANDFRGLIETFVEANEEYSLVIREFPFELYTLDANSDSREHHAFQIYDTLCQDADVIIATHAALIIDRNFGGRVILREKSDTDFCLVVADEANRLEEAGELVLGAKRALSSFRRDREAIQPIIKSAIETHLAAEQGLAFSEEVNAHMELADDFDARMKGVVFGVEPRKTFLMLDGTEPWLEDLAALQASTLTMISLLERVAKGGDERVTEDATVVARRLRERTNDIADILEILRKKKANRGLASNQIPPEMRTYSDVRLDLSPQRTEPSLVSKPKRGAMVFQRLWNAKTGPKADAIFITSATLGAPGSGGRADLRTILRSIGLDLTDARLNHGFETSIEMKSFGRLRRVVLAHPSTPKASVKIPAGEIEFDPDRPRRNPEWISYVAESIQMALNDVWRPDGRNHVVALCNSIEETEVLADAVRKLVSEDLVHHRGSRQTLDRGYDWLADTQKGVLLTYGSYDGVDKPGLIDHLIIPRLPYPPSDTENFYRYRKDEKTGERTAGFSLEKMIVILKQALGRPIRKSSDEASIWILDPRIGTHVNSYMIAAEFSEPLALNAFPKRFEADVEAAVYLRRKADKVVIVDEEENEL